MNKHYNQGDNPRVSNYPSQFAGNNYNGNSGSGNQYFGQGGNNFNKVYNGYHNESMGNHGGYRN